MVDGVPQQATANDEGIAATPEYDNATKLLEEIKVPASEPLE